MINNKISWIIAGFIVLSLIGFADSGYLALKHYQGESPSCSFAKGCDKVVSSEWGTVAGVPVSVGGVFYYITVLILSLWYFETENKLFLKIIFPLTLIGFLVSMWFVYLQLFVINEICVYCMGSAITSTLLFILGALIVRQHGGKKSSYG